MNSERMKKFISLLLAGSMALGLLLPGVSAFAEDGDEQPSSEPSVAQTLVEKITEAAAAAAQNESPPTPETPSQPDTPPQGDPEPLSESPGEPPAPPGDTDPEPAPSEPASPEPDAPGVTEGPAQPEQPAPPEEEKPPDPPEEEKPPEEPTPAEQKEKEQELEEARAHRSDPAADVEIPSEWAAMFEKLDLTGKYPDDLLAVARTQIGYTESEANYAEADGQRRGYTRYGAWNQDPYAPWNLTFVAFCLEYAQVPEDAFPREDDPETWRQTLTEQNLWTTEAPKPGDVAFLPKDPETAIEEETEAALVGIVDEIEEDGTLWVIAGDMENEVRRIELASDQIIGFGVLPPGEERQDPQPPDPAGTDVPADNGEPPADYDTPQAPLDPAESPAVPGTPAGNLAGDLAQRIAEGLARTGDDGQPPNGAAPPGEDGGAPDEPEEKLPDDLTGEDPVELPEDLPEEPEGEPELPAEEELVEELPEELPFLQTQTLDGVTVTVTAEPGVFPEGAVLSVTKVPVAAQITVDAAVAPQRDGSNVALSYTFDVSILDAEGNPIQPADDQTVQVSFSMAQVADANLAPRVYHLAGEGEDLSARPLDVTTDGDTATVTTDGFSFYTVEFTYGDLQYVMEGDTTIPLDYILDYVGLTGEVTDVTVSAPDLFAAYQDNGVWYVVALEAFQTQEWMKVVIGGVEYEIVVTDAFNINNSDEVLEQNGIEYGGDTLTNFAQNMSLATIKIDDSIRETDPVFTCTDQKFFMESNVVYWRGSLNPYSENVETGSFSLRYPRTAITKDGVRKDVLITFSNLLLYTPRQMVKKTWPTSWKVAVAKGKAPAPYVTTDNSDYRTGRSVEILIQIVEPIENSSDPVIPVEGSFVYTHNDINVVRPNSNANFAGLYGAGQYLGNDSDSATPDPAAGYQANYNYSEAAQILSGRSTPADKIYIPQKALFANYIDGDGRFVGTQSGNGSYSSGLAVLADAKTGIRIQSWMAGGSQAKVEYYMLTDGITHTITSSSGLGGKIEVWDSGIIGQGNQLQDNNDARTFDVPDGKSVTYKLTPNPGFHPSVWVDGEETQPVTWKDADGADYYTYTFNSNSDDHTIIVKWLSQDELPETGGVGLPLPIKLAICSMVFTTPVSWIKRKWGVGG